MQGKNNHKNTLEKAMLQFKPINLENIDEINEILKSKQNRTCDNTVGALYMWREYYQSEYAIHNGMLYMKVKINDTINYTLPYGVDSLSNALDILYKHGKQVGTPFTMCVIPEESIPQIESHFNGKIQYDFDRDMSDYLYLAKDLSELKGRKFSGQRNHINKFKKLYPEYHYEQITAENIEKVLTFYDEFAKNMNKTSDTAIEESKRTKELLQNLNKLPMFGGFIEVEDNIVGISVGEIVGDTLYVHIEKALKEYHGSYQMIMQEFAKHNVNDSVIYINREDDTGDLGLRTSKLSYHPIKLLDKYTVIISE
jgi:uncharacterized protein